MSNRSAIESTVFTIAFVGIVVLLNILALGAFKRVDLTRDGQYTLSEASRDTVKNLDDRLTVKAYFSADLPPPYSANARYVKDLLDEYYAASGGGLSYEFLDPLAEETEEDKETRKEVRRDVFGRAIRQETAVEHELRSLGIQPVEVRVNEGDSIEVKRAYMGISLRYGDQQEVIPVVVNTGSLEYDLTTLMRKLTRTSVPTVGLITGREGLDPQQDLSQVMALLSQQYEVQQVDLAAEEGISDDVDALLVAGPRTPLAAPEIGRISEFVSGGGSAAFFLDSITVDLSTTSYQEIEHGLGDLLGAWGVRPTNGVLLDADCAQISVAQPRGRMRISQLVRYPFVPTARQLDQEHPLTRGISEVSFPFVTALEVTAPQGGSVAADVLVSSSDKSWTERPPLDLNPLQRWSADIEFTGPHPIVATLSGIGGGNEGGGRALIVGGSSLLQNQFLSATSQALVLNLVDWLLLDEAMLSIRSRGLGDAPLDELSDSKRTALKYLNIVGVPLLFAAFGLVGWRLRERRRRLITV